MSLTEKSRSIELSSGQGTGRILLLACSDYSAGLFCQVDHLIDAHMQALLDLPKPSNSLCSLRSFHDATRGLPSLGKSEQMFGIC